MRRRQQRGSAVLYTIVLSPLIMMCLALALEAGALQLEKARLRSAADVATESASSALSRDLGGTVDLDAGRADSVTRQALADNLAPLATQLAGVTADEVAGAAEVVAVTEVPATDPFDRERVVSRPTLFTRLRAPVSSGLLALAGVPRVVTLTIVSSADLRVTGVQS
jgi:Flp pilus assembly protein TadG